MKYCIMNVSINIIRMDRGTELYYHENSQEWREF